MKNRYEKLQTYWTRTNNITRPIFKHFFGYTYEEAPEIEGNYLVLCNHNSNMDSWMCGLSFKRQMYFLAGENMFRLGFLSWMLTTFWDPIPIIKGKSDVTAMMRLIRHLKEGRNACLYPEGNRSFNGLTGSIETTIGKLVKTSGASLVTYKFEGMYFSTPRWGNYKRKGKIHGAVVNVYTKEELKNMSVEEIHKHITEDLAEDAYATQEKNPIKYKNKKRAECIESALFICPKCKEVGSIKSKKHSFWCTKCGSKAEFTEYGYIEGDFEYNTVKDWDLWQQEELKIYIDTCLKEKPNAPILQDNYVELAHINVEHKEIIKSTGKFEMFSDRIKVGDVEHFFDSIENIDMVFRRTLLFSLNNNENYQIFSKEFPCARVYIFAYRYLRDKKKILGK